MRKNGWAEISNSLGGDPDVLQESSESGLPWASKPEENLGPSWELNDHNVSITANKGCTKKNGWAEIAELLAEDRRVCTEIEAKRLEARDVHEWAKAEAAVEKVHIKQEVKLEMEKA